MKLQWSLLILVLAMAGNPLAAPAGNERYYQFDHPDLRLCPSPTCGGHFIRQVNIPRTRCADGSWESSCYAAELDLDELDWNLQAKTRLRERFQEKAVLVKGVLRQGGIMGNEVPVLKVSAAWEIASGENPEGIPYVQVKASAITCITQPCDSLMEKAVNLPYRRFIAGLNLSGTGASSEQIFLAQQLVWEEGLLVAGTHYPIEGPGGRSRGLDASALYLPLPARQPDGATCGGIAGLTCPTGQFCDIDIPNACGGADLSGICITPPQVCTEHYAPVCGCDGITYGNECFRQAAGVQLDHVGECGGDGSVWQ